jgi:hypothetical protein
MRRVSLVAAVALTASVFLAGTRTASGQETKTASGNVTAVANDSITISVKGSDMKFNVDDKTMVVAKGGSTKSAAAKKEGMSGPKLTDVIKTGQAVEIKYHDMGGGTLHAANIRAIASAGAGSMSSDAPAAKTANGTVKSVAADSLTVTGGDGKDMTFAVDSSTKVVGTGVGTKTSASGGKGSFADLVHSGDKVAVTYHETGGAMHAATVRITAKNKM